MSKLVIIPTFNEIENLQLIVDRVRAQQLDLDILVVDDASTDGTAELADKLVEDPNIHVMHRTSNRGLGPSYLDGFKWAAERGYEAIIQMDADGSHRPEDLKALLDAFDRGADLVIGSRWVKGGSVVNWPFHRLLLSQGGNSYARILLHLGVKDVTGGYRVIRVSAFPALNLGEVESRGYCFQVDITRRAVKSGLKVVEVPITFVEREHGESKMNGEIVREAMWRVTKWGFGAD